MLCPKRCSTNLQRSLNCRTIDRRLFQSRQTFLSSSHSESPPRPQLPFLYSSSQASAPRILARLLSTEQKRNFRLATRDIAKWTVVFWTFAGLFAISKFGIDNELLERAHPTPPDWSWITRWKLRSALASEQPEAGFAVDWAYVGNLYEQALERLEDTNNDGVGIRPRLGEGEDILVEGIGRTGSDISMKPEAWRRGYHQVLMGSARAAEHLDSFVRDITRDIIFPQNVVLGATNPRPKHVPYGSPAAPKEDDCESAYEQPHVFYMKILTTYGFTTRQRIEAALAYANWLRYKQAFEAARDMYTWAFDIALSAMPSTVSLPVDPSTGILNQDTSRLTSNVLLVATSLATHHAQIGNYHASLPILLSVLRAQQNLMPSKASPSANNLMPSGVLTTLTTIFAPNPYPDAAPSGDELASTTVSSACASAGTMLHIGEVLYASDLSNTLNASSPSRLQLEGLSWTRRAVAQAERNLKEMIASTGVTQQEASLRKLVSSPSTDREEFSTLESKKRCVECISAGLDNWQKMIEPFHIAELKQQNASLKAYKTIKQVEAQITKDSWLASLGALLISSDRNRSDESSSNTEKHLLEYQWTNEAREVHDRKIAFRRLSRENRLPV